MDKKILIETGKSSFWIIENFYKNVFQEMNKLPLVVKPEIMVYGKKAHQQRDVGFFSDTSEGYMYSKTVTNAQPLTEKLKEMLAKVNNELDTKFNGILVNRYNCGKDYLSAHSDDEKGLDKNKMVAGLAFGVTRKFRIRDKISNKILNDFEIGSGTLYVMDGEFQKEFKHEIPRQTRIKDARISLTFRTHVI